METTSLKEKYGYMVAELAKVGKAASVIDETNVYQEANQFTRPFLNKMLDESLLPGSKIEGMENFKDFLAQIKSGKRGLILMEHYSNMDLPAIIYLLDRDGGEEGKEIIGMIVFMSQSLGFSVLSEYVETEKQRKVLESLGCHEYQGYLFSPAVPLEKL